MTPDEKLELKRKRRQMEEYINEKSHSWPPRIMIPFVLFSINIIGGLVYLIDPVDGKDYLLTANGLVVIGAVLFGVPILAGVALDWIRRKFQSVG